ncbi:MAG TPA: barstar family protein [Burkholderiales bacterium]|nr:barstar family protein [Burkholderiales bacterium]
MGKLIERLQDASRSGVYRAARADEVMDAARGSKLLLAKIRFDEKEGLLKNLATALRFPEWFGQNWDALEDSLTDLSWLGADGHVLLFEKPKAGDDLGVLIDVLRSTADSWAARGKPFFAVFIDPARALPLPSLFTET